MEALTPAERRGALVVLCLLALGAGRDLWRASRPLPIATTAGAAMDPQPAPGAAASGMSASGGDTAGLDAPRSVILDLNRATATELDALPGIGPVLANRIVAHRQRHGPFASREELLAVRGIGPRLLARLRPLVRVGSTLVPDRPDTLARGRPP